MKGEKGATSPKVGHNRIAQVTERTDKTQSVELNATAQALEVRRDLRGVVGEAGIRLREADNLRARP